MMSSRTGINDRTESPGPQGSTPSDDRPTTTIAPEEFDDDGELMMKKPTPLPGSFSLDGVPAAGAGAGAGAGAAAAGIDNDAVTLDTASVTIDDWTTASAATGADSSRGYSSRRSSLTSSSRRSSLTSAMSGSTRRRGSVQSSICSYDDTATASRRGSTASEISNDGTALSSTTGTTTASTRRRRLFFGLVTTVEFDKHEPANRRLDDGSAKVSHPTETRWESAPVAKRKLLSSRRRKSGKTSGGGGAGSFALNDNTFDGRGGAPSIPTRSNSYPAPDRSTGIRGAGGDRRSSIEIKRPRRRLSVEEVTKPLSTHRASSSSLSNFLIPLEITSGGTTEHSHAPSSSKASKEGRRRGSGWMPHLPRRRGSIEQPPVESAATRSATAATTTVVSRPRRLSVEMAARRASLEMPVVVEEEGDELEVSAPFAMPSLVVDEDESSVATLSAMLDLEEGDTKAETQGAAAEENANDSSYSSCLTDTSSSSRNAKATLTDADLQQDDSDPHYELEGSLTPAVRMTTSSSLDQLFADESAEIVTAVPFSGGAAPRRRRLSLVDKVHHPSQHRPRPTDEATPPTPPTRRSSGARRGSFLTNLFASLSFSSSGSSSDGTREFPHEPSATGYHVRPVPNVTNSQNRVADADIAGGGSSPSPSRTRSLLRSSLSPRLPRRVPSDGSSPSEDEAVAPVASSRHGPATDRPCRQPARRSSLLSLLHSFASRIEVDLAEVTESPFAAATESPAALSSSSLPKQPCRRPSHHPEIIPSPVPATPGTRRSSWQLLAIEKPHRSENDAPIDRRVPLPESPPRAASEPSRRGSLLGMLLFFRTSGDDGSVLPTNDHATVRSSQRNNSTASSTDESDDEMADGKDRSRTGDGAVAAAGLEPPRRRDGIKPSPFLRRHASCDGRFELTKAPSLKALGMNDDAIEGLDGAVDDDDFDRRRSSMVITLPSRKMTLEPNHPLYRVGDNGQQATIAAGPKGRGGRRRWSLISNLPGRWSITGASRTTDADDPDVDVAAAAPNAPALGSGARSCSDSALLVVW